MYDSVYGEKRGMSGETKREVYGEKRGMGERGRES